MKRLLFLWSLTIGLSPTLSAQTDRQPTKTDRQPTQTDGQNASLRLDWSRLTPLPDPIGFAGPFVGTHPVEASEAGTSSEVLLVAGGANFAAPEWESDKVWHDRVFVGLKENGDVKWIEAGNLDQPIAYGAAVSTNSGVLCLGGTDGAETFRDCFLLRWNNQSKRIETSDYPPLPKPLAYGAATRIGDTVYVCGGQTGLTLDSAINELWALDLTQADQSESFRWRKLPSCPGKTRALNLTVSQQNGAEQNGAEQNGSERCVYVISGRRQDGVRTEFLVDNWEYSPSRRHWRRRSDAPRSVMAGTAVGVGVHYIAVLGGADGRYFGREDELKDKHPGFVRRAIAYDTVADRWLDAGTTPINQVTTIAVRWGNGYVLASGEIRPRVRTPDVYQVNVLGLEDDGRSDRPK